MPVSALRVTSQPRNGVGAFILQCKKLEFNYCDAGGSSKGMKAFLSSPMFPKFAASHRAIQFQVCPRPNNHPQIRAHYISGREKVICVRNLEATQILQKAELLRDTDGQIPKFAKGARTVKSMNQSVRGIWDPFHPPAPPRAVATAPASTAEPPAAKDSGAFIEQEVERKGALTGDKPPARHLHRGRNLLAEMAERANRGLLGRKVRRKGKL